MHPPHALPDDAVLELIRELERRHRAEWKPRLAALRAAGVPLNAGDDDDDEDDDDEDDDDDEGEGKGKGKGRTGGDDLTAELEAQRKATAAANRELRKLKSERDEAATKAKAEAGEFRELYEEAKARLEELEAGVTRDRRERLAIAALTKAKAKNPARAVKLLDLDDLDDEAAAERAVKRLTKSDEYLFETSPTRQKRGAGGHEDDDDDDDRGRDRGAKRRPVNRLRRGLEASAP